MVGLFNVGRTVRIGLPSVVSPSSKTKSSDLFCASRLKQSEIFEVCLAGARKPLVP
jgi:hypothetical protein